MFTGLFFVFAITGCYSPHVQSGGFACSTTDNPPCPSGFFCINGLCVDHQGSGGGGGTVQDFALPTTADLSTPPSGDLSMPASGDMAHGGGPSDMACFAFGYECNSDQTCCNQCCAGGCTIFGYCALQ